VEAFKNIFENTLTKICNLNRDESGLKVPTILLEYRTTCNNLTGKTPFIFVYGQEVVVPLYYLIPRMCIVGIIDMTERGTAQEILTQLMELEEEKTIAGFNKEVQKAKDKSWHDKHIKKKKCKEGYMVLLYDNKYLQHPGNLRMHWIGPYQIKFVIGGGVVQLQDLASKEVEGMLNGSRLKL
jgi:hypothetical protein